MSDNAPQAATPELRLPGYFPLIDKPARKCQKAATSFFECFSEHGKQKPDDRSTTAGQEGLEQCAKQLKSYEACMTKQGADKNPKLVRAPVAYLPENR
jgi:hypothetical protein